MHRLLLRPLICRGALLLGAFLHFSSESPAQGVGRGQWGTHLLQWRPTGPMPGAGPAVLRFADTAAAPGLLYAGSQAGLIASLDGGRTWELRSRFEGSIFGFLYVGPSPRDADLLLACPYGDGIHRSVDGGRTFTRPPGAPDDRYIWDPIFAPSCGFTVYLASGDGVWRSLDAGLHFTQVLSGIFASGGYGWTLAVDFDDPMHACLNALYQGIYVTRDGGDTWTLKPYPSGVTSPLSFAIDPANGERLLLGDRGAVYLSTDGGDHWTGGSAGLGNYIIDAVAFDPDQPARFYAGLRTGGVALSTDTGATWTASSDPGLDRAGGGPVALHASRFDPNLLLVGDTGGIFRSDDRGTTFHRSNGGLHRDADVVDLEVDPFDPDHLVALTGGSVYSSRDGGATWDEAAGLTKSFGFSLAADAAIRGRFYLGAWSSALWRSDDGGASFQQVLAPGIVGMHKVTAHPAIGGRIFATGGDLMRSDDGGATFQSAGAPVNGWCWGFAISPANPDVMHVDDGVTIWSTHDGGATWRAADVGPASLVREIVADPVDPERAWAGVPLGGLYRTVDGGLTWTLLADELRNAGALIAPGGNRILVDDELAAAAWISNDGGATAHPLGHGLPSSTQALAVSPFGAIYAATRGAGVQVLR